MSKYLKFYLLLYIFFFNALKLNAQGKYSNDVQIDWVRHYAGLSAPGNDEANLIGSDSLGNIVVVGSSQRGEYSYKDLFIKYSNSGSELLRKEINQGEIQSLNFDSKGNLYITGKYYDWGPLKSSRHNSTKENSYNIFDNISKYNTDGEQEWIIGSEMNDYFIDESENLYVSSWIYKIEGGGWASWSYRVGVSVTKYSPDATVSWIDTVYFDTTNIIPDYAQNIIAVDNQKNIIIAFDNYIAKLDSNAKHIWVKQDTLYQPIDMVVSNENNIYLIRTTFSNPFIIPSDENYNLIKILPNGNIDWTYEFKKKINPNDYVINVELDKWNNIYVGTSKLGTFLIIDKIGKDGTLKWNYKFPETNAWEIYFFTVTSIGQIIVGRSSGEIFNIDTSGAFLWTKDLNVPKDYLHYTFLKGGITRDYLGNITIACTEDLNTNYNWRTIQFDKNGDMNWEAVYDYTGLRNNYVYDIAMDNSDNVYVTGRSESYDKGYLDDPNNDHDGHHWDFATLKYSKNGDLKWISREGADAHDGDYYVKMFLSVGQTGNLTICGAHLFTYNDYGAKTVKYNLNGEKLWDTLYVQNPEFMLEGMETDSNGNIYLIGTNGNNNYQQRNWMLMKYSNLGQVEWINKLMDSPVFLTNNICCRYIALDNNENVVIGTTIYGTDNYAGIKIKKYSSKGNLIWDKFIDKPSYQLHDLKIGFNGNVYLSLLKNTSEVSYGAIMLDNDGKVLWSSWHDGGCAIDRPITIDSEGNVYVTGCSTIKYNNKGEEKWFLSDLEGDAITCDKTNDIYIIRENLILKYSSSGTKLWEFKGNEKWETPYTEFRKIIVDDDLNVYIVGNTTFNTKDTSGIVYSTMKLVQGFTAIEEKFSAPKKFNLFQNYPNPFNPKTTIKYSIPKQSLVTLKVYDILGKEITTLINEEKQAGNYKVTWDAANLPSGVYFYRITTGDYVETKKMNLLK